MITRGLETVGSMQCRSAAGSHAVGRQRIVGARLTVEPSPLSWNQFRSKLQSEANGRREIVTSLGCDIPRSAQAYVSDISLEAVARAQPVTFFRP